MNQRQMPLYTFLALALGLWAVMEYKPAPEIPVASHMPALTIQPLGSDAPVQWQPAAGNVTLVNFFASWCVPCLAEHPQLKTLAKVEGIALIGIAWNDKPSALKAFLDQHGNPFDSVYLDSSGRAAIAAGIRGVPETYVVDKQGKVRLHIQGAMNEEAAQKLIPMLKEWQDAPAQ